MSSPSSLMDRIKADKDIIEVVIAVGALVLAIVSILISVTQYMQIVALENQINLDPGELIIHPPTEFCIARGFLHFPSDHIVIPFHIENTGRGAKTFDRPTLFFNDSKTGEQQQYWIAGYLPNIGFGSFGNEWYEVARGITVPERSLQRYVLVFHSDLWWDESSPDFIYRFIYDGDPVENVEMRLVYYEAPGNEPVYWQQGGDDIFLSMPVYGTVNKLELGESVVNNLLQSDQVKPFPRLINFLHDHPQGNYNIDCFADEDFPEPRK